MRTTTALNHIDYLKGMIASVYASAKFYHPTQPQLCEQYMNILKSYSAWERMPQWAKSKVGDYREYKRKELDQYTMGLYVLPNGDKVITRYAWDSFPEEVRERIRNGGSLPFKVFWMNVEERCDKNGNITITKTPTDDVFWDSATMAR